MDSASSSYDPTASSSEYYSPRIAEMIEELRKNPGMNKVESEVESSKVTWSELSSSSLVGEALAAENSRVFKRLQKKWPGGFFQEWEEGRWELGEKIAEGGQAELFEAWRLSSQGERGDVMVVKMFKEGVSLQDLQRLLPRAMLAYKWTRNAGFFYGGLFCNTIFGAMLFNGRFALSMGRKWGDLRKLIDARMIDNGMHGPPFTDKQTPLCMIQIAQGMEGLHTRNVTHGDLKAANVLVRRISHDELGLSGPIHNGYFGCEVADYECSVGVVGTGFWRPPEILLAMKNQKIRPELFTKASDVYSYGMTCYEILSGCIPFEVEGFASNDYDKAIGGYRPSLPSNTPLWMKELLNRCWHEKPSKRPTFKEIVSVFEKHPAHGGNCYNNVIIK